MVGSLRNEFRYDDVSLGVRRGEGKEDNCLFLIPLLLHEAGDGCNSSGVFAQAVDAGDSMFVHVFGAYFGLAVSYVFGTKREPKEHELEGASYHSDIFAMIGECQRRLSSFGNSSRSHSGN